MLNIGKLCKIYKGRYNCDQLSKLSDFLVFLQLAFSILSCKKYAQKFSLNFSTWSNKHYEYLKDGCQIIPTTY